MLGHIRDPGLKHLTQLIKQLHRLNLDFHLSLLAILLFLELFHEYTLALAAILRYRSVYTFILCYVLPVRIKSRCNPYQCSPLEQHDNG